MFTLQRFFATLFLHILKFGGVLAQFGLSVASPEVAIGQKFIASWTLSETLGANEPESFDICLNNADATQFIPVASITPNNASSGAVSITLDDTIFPTTYLLGIRFPGCSFLLARVDNFEVVSPFCGSVSPRAILPPAARSLPLATSDLENGDERVMDKKYRFI